MSPGDPIGPHLAALADATRRDILDELATRGAASATALAGRLTVSRQAVMKHLRVLESVGAVRSERVGREVRYSVDPAPMRRAAAWFERAAREWDDSLGALKRAAEGSPAAAAAPRRDGSRLIGGSAEADVAGALATPGVRQPVFARHGMVCTSQPAAAAAGLRILQSGGNAVDAAIATAACLPVVEPCSNGLGSDAFALIWDGTRLHGLNGSGRAPAASDAAALRARGFTEMPEHGWDAVTVPGMVRAWADTHARFGRLRFADVLAPAIELAEDGFLVPGVVAWGWGRGVRAAQHRLASAPDPAQDAFAALFGPAPRVGELRRFPEMAATLRAIADTGGDAFYTGALAEAIVRFSERTGGPLTRADLAGHASQWVEPISARYRDHEVWEIPPNGQGIAALLALAVLDGLDPERAADWHVQIEAVKLALADTHAHVADPDAVPVPTSALLSDAHAARRRALIGDRAGVPVAVDPRGSDTVYLCVADADGMMVSFIQSNFAGFGSGVVVPGTGIALQNRGAGFSLTPGHPNKLAGGKRPFHTIIPGFLTRGGEPVGPFGVMGGHMQAQGHVQVVLHTVDGRDDPQTALGRPRWFWDAATSRVLVERAAGPDAVAALRARGHDAVLTDDAAIFGRGQAIWRVDGGLVGGSEPRADGVPMGW